MSKENKIVRVDEKEFELEDGTIIPHFEELEIVPTIEEFQNIYDYWNGVLHEYERKINQH